MTMDPVLMVCHLGRVIKGTLFCHHCHEALWCQIAPKLALSSDNSFTLNCLVNILQGDVFTNTLENTRRLLFPHMPPGSHASEAPSVNNSDNPPLPPDHTGAQLCLFVDKCFWLVSSTLYNCLAHRCVWISGLYNLNRSIKPWNNHWIRSEDLSTLTLGKWLNFYGLSFLIYKRKSLDFLNFVQT